MEREAGAPGPANPVAYVNIMQGCDNFCTYCIVPYTRGRQKSRASGAILDDCRAALENGAREITLLGQNVNAFGRDKHGDGTSFARLLALVAELPGLERLRYVTPHPKDMGPEDVEAFAALPSSVHGCTCPCSPDQMWCSGACTDVTTVPPTWTWWPACVRPVRIWPFPRI